MKKILFVCHGNICRSPMAEMVMKHLVKNAGLEDEFFIDSAACRTDEIGNGIHYGTKNKLSQMNVPFTNHRARLVSWSDFKRFDFIVAMDDENMRDLRRCFGASYRTKCRKLLEFASLSRDVADPWWTGDFDKTWDDILAGCTALLDFLLR